MSLAAPPRPFAHTPRPETRRAVPRDGILLRPATTADVGPMRDFLLSQYDTFNAIDNTPEGHRVFGDFVAAPALRARLEAGSVVTVAERHGAILGVCEMHRDGYLTLLYVHGDRQGRGLGRRLLVETLRRLRAEAPSARTIRVRATPYARGFYARLGFRPLEAEARTDRGLRFYPFVLDLDAV
ncbi:GNAT family N-acetyltransferase [uncultured Rhodospira sp.]|uniref:GNAT family N-acetyltransferase n=1 Tax=uncultured Rhodospira sp. TaxID=1936189 RepID=UPI002621CF48|nr:GNAT family N-acetyltransferase [uncultured Rhodospira sp.]